MKVKCFEDKWGNKHNLSYVKIFFQKNIAINKDLESIEKKAFILYLEDKGYTTGVYNVVCNVHRKKIFSGLQADFKIHEISPS